MFSSLCTNELLLDLTGLSGCSSRSNIVVKKLYWNFIYLFLFFCTDGLFFGHLICKLISCLQGSTGVTFNDVAGIEVAVEELQEVAFKNS